MDAIDLQILRLLERDAKMSIKEVAAHLNMSKTPIYERIKRLEQQNYIEHYTAVLNPKKLDRGMTVFCFVSLEVQKLDEINTFREAVSKIPEVTECYLLGGSNDFLLKVLVKDLEAYHQFSSGKLAALNNISQIKSNFVLDTVKKANQLLVE
jgi:DNA-binding Lrp family transcriptional regulator